MLTSHEVALHTIESNSSQLIVLNAVGTSTQEYCVKQGAHLQLDVVLVGDMTGEIDLTLPVILAGEGASADVRVLGLAQSSRIRIAASMQIAPGAQQTDGQLSMRGLLLDDDASIAMTPGLDVAANDVSASHGASIDRVDLDKSFYLESRGLSTSDAQRMIWRGMMSDMVSRYDPHLVQDTQWMEDVVSQLI